MSTPTTPSIAMANSLGSPATPTTPLAPGVQQRLSLKQTAIDTWSMKEQLGLASAVLRSGDQNWVSVSRQMKPFSQDGRPQDWFSQKNCALQYKLLLDKVDTPRRKRGEKAIESVETPGEVIVRRLTSDRIKELRKMIEAETAELMQLDEEIKLLSDENISDDKLRAIEAAIHKEETEEAERKAAHEKWLREREEKKQAIQAALKAHSSKLPLKGAAAAAVQQAGAARRASTQSERSSFSDVDSPLPVYPSQLVASSLTNIPDSNESSPVKKEPDVEPMQETSENPLPQSSAPSSPIKSPPEEHSVKAMETTIKAEDSSKELAKDDNEVDTIVDETPIEAVEKEKEEPIEPKPDDEEKDPAVADVTDIEPIEMPEIITDIPEDTVEEKKEEVLDETDSPQSEKEPDNEVDNELENEPDNTNEIMPTDTPKICTDDNVEPAATTDEYKNDKQVVLDDEEEDDDEVIIKKETEIEEPMLEEIDKKTIRPSLIKTPRIKKTSEVSEDDCDSADPDSTSGRSRRDTRSKKISERSDDAEESPGPPRATRRSKKVDATSGDGSTDREDGSNTTATSVENKRLSRVKDTETSARGRRGSGATNPTTSRSSSPVGSGDESEVELTPVRGLRARKTSGRAKTDNEVDSAPVSPSPSTIDGSTAQIVVSAATDNEETSSGIDEWKKCALNIINELKSHKFADHVFSVLQPSDSDANPILLRSTDISTIQKNLDNGILKSNTDLHHALHHLFLNAVMSLASDSEEYEMALNIYRDCITQIDEVRLLSLGGKSPVTKSLGKGKEKRDLMTSSTPLSDENRRKRSLEDTPVSSAKRRKR